jgi:hypothetical protein
MLPAQHMLISVRGLEWESVVVVPFTVYLDDSGTSPTQQVACATALIIPAPRLLLMEREWNNLKAKEGFSDFHTSEFVARNPKSEFAGWSDEKHERVFRRVCEITKKYVVQIFSVVVNKPDYDSIIPADLRDYTGQYHYTWAIRHVLAFAQTWRVNNPDIPPYEWVFDFMQLGEPSRVEIEEAMEGCELMADLRRGAKGDYLNYSFRPRNTLAGLQCADLVAWTNYRHGLEKFKGTPVHPFAQVSWDLFSKKPDNLRRPFFPEPLDWNCSLSIKPDHLRDWVEKEVADGTGIARFREWQRTKGQAKSH